MSDYVKKPKYRWMLDQLLVRCAPPKKESPRMALLAEMLKTKRSKGVLQYERVIPKCKTYEPVKEKVRKVLERYAKKEDDSELQNPEDPWITWRKNQETFRKSVIGTAVPVPPGEPLRKAIKQYADSARLVKKPRKVHLSKISMVTKSPPPTAPDYEEEKRKALACLEKIKSWTGGNPWYGWAPPPGEKVQKAHTLESVKEESQKAHTLESVKEESVTRSSIISETWSSSTISLSDSCKTVDTLSICSDENLNMETPTGSLQSFESWPFLADCTSHGPKKISPSKTLKSAKLRDSCPSSENRDFGQVNLRQVRPEKEKCSADKHSSVERKSRPRAQSVPINFQKFPQVSGDFGQKNVRQVTPAKEECPIDNKHPTVRTRAQSVPMGFQFPTMPQESGDLGQDLRQVPTAKKECPTDDKHSTAEKKLLSRAQSLPMDFRFHRMPQESGNLRQGRPEKEECPTDSKHSTVQRRRRSPARSLPVQIRLMLMEKGGFLRRQQLASSPAQISLTSSRSRPKSRKSRKDSMSSQ